VNGKPSLAHWLRNAMGYKVFAHSNKQQHGGVVIHRIFSTAAAVMIAACAGCAGDPPAAKPEQGGLSPGTAQISVNGGSVVSTHAVTCQPVKSTTLIAAGDTTSGATVVVSSADTLTVQRVTITNVSGFTGSFDRGVQGDATAGLTTNTYDITGAAMGFGPDPFPRATARFNIKVAC
jgi:lipoprotein LpqH